MKKNARFNYRDYHAVLTLVFKINMFLSDDLQGAQSETEAKQEIQHLRKELLEAQELARASKQKCFELQGEIKISATLWGPMKAAECDLKSQNSEPRGHCRVSRTRPLRGLFSDIHSTF